MIEYKQDNILNFTSWNFLAHSVSTKGVYNAGLAKQIREEYPGAYEEYMKMYNEERATLGNYSLYTTAGGKKILNVVTQADVGTEKRQVDYEAFYVAFEDIRNRLEAANKNGKNYVLAVPYGISCGLAGGNWAIIRTMLEELFFDSPATLCIVEYKSKK